MRAKQIEDAYPLSPTQQGILFHALYAPESGMYVEQLTCALRGDLDLAAFAGAWQFAIDRHPILRSAFVWKNLEKPMQVVGRRAALPLTQHDWRALADAEQQACLADFLAKDRCQGFDLSAAPLMRLALLRLSASEYRFVWSCHHLLLDGWSIALVLKEVFGAYVALCQGRDPALARPRPYRDYIAWLQRQVLSQAEAFWRKTLKGLTAPTPLVVDRPAGTSAGASAGPAEQQVSLGEASTATLQGLARQHGLTLNTLVQGAWALLLHRYSGLDDVLFGATVAGRPPELAGVEAMVGLFINTLPMRVRIEPWLPALDWLRQLQDAQLALRQYEYSPLVQVQGWSELPRGTPLFESIVVFENYPISGAGLDPGGRAPVEVRDIHLVEQSNYALTLLAAPGAALDLRINYDAARFAPATIDRMLGHLRTLLDGIAARPSQPLADLPLLTEAERQQLLVEWNATAFSLQPSAFSLQELFEAQAARTPDAIALVFDATDDDRRPTIDHRPPITDELSAFSLQPSAFSLQMTYAELNARANQLAHHLRGLGVGPEVVVAIQAERSLELVIGLLGILKAGGAYLPLDPSYPAERLAFMLEDSQAQVLITAQDERRKRKDEQPTTDHRRPTTEEDAEWSVVGGRSLVIQTVDLARDWPAITRQPITCPDSGANPNNLAYAIYTSGSTGQPKGALNTHRAIVNRLLWMQDAYRLTADDAVLQKTPFSFDVSVWEFFWPLLTGARLVLARPGGHRDSAYLARAIAEHDITTLHFVPSMLQVFLDEPALDMCRRLRRVICSGEALSYDLLERFFAHLGAELHNLYGPTEAAVDVTAWACARADERRSVPIGRPIANTQIYLLDRHMQPAPIGVPGELYIGGVQLARGYLNRPDLTAEKFIPNPFATTDDRRPTTDEPAATEGRQWSVVGGRLYRTGDLARYRPDGAIEFLGRIDHQVKLRGFRIELGEIEAVLAQHEAVRDAVVLAREDERGEKRLIAYVIPTNDQRRTTNEASPSSSVVGRRSFVAELRSFLATRLPDYMIPSAFVKLSELPLTPNGKLDRKALPAPDGRGSEPGAGYIAPRTPIEELLASIWAGVLHIARVGAEDNFFALGGHSLLATQVISRIRDTFQVELPLRALFDAPTLARLAEAIAGARGAEPGQLAPPLRPAPRTGELPLSFAQQRLWFLDQLAPGNPAYHMPSAIYLAGRLDMDALRRSLGAIVRRHEILRTRFVTTGGRPAQIIDSAAPQALPLLDLRGLPSEAREPLARRLAEQEARRPFDLARGPLLRAALLRLGEAEHVLLATMHHIVADGWSRGVLIRELAALYSAFAQGEDSPLPELPIQYADYAIWQREWLQGEVLERQLAYWQRSLADLPALQLPTDEPRPPVSSFAGAQHDVALPQPLHRALAELSRREGVTLFMTLAAAFQVLLARYSGQTDFGLGTPIAGRTRAETEPLIGFFVNTLVLRADLSGNPSFRALLRRVRETALDAFAHQDLPFEQIVEALQPERDLSRNPLFEVMFALQNAPATALELPELTLRPLAAEVTTTHFDLGLSLTEAAAGLVGILEYRTDLFAAATIARLPGHFQTLLEGIVAAPDQRLADLPLLTTAECYQLLVEWNAPAASPRPSAISHQEPDAERCIHELFAAQAARTPDAIALLTTTDHRPPTTEADLAFSLQPSAFSLQVSYGELERRANQLAHHLRSLGVGPEVRVGVCIERSAELVIGLLGVLKAGGAYVPLDPAYPAERIAFMLEDSQAAVLIAATTDQRPTITDQRPTTNEAQSFVVRRSSLVEVNLAADWPTIAMEPDSTPDVPLAQDNLAYLIYTSGTTGRPKAVTVEHRSLSNVLRASQQHFQFCSGDVVPWIASAAFDIALFELLNPLLAGGTAIVLGYQQVLDTARLLAVLERCTVVHTVPSLMRQIVQGAEAGRRLDRMRMAFTGGDAVPPDLLAEMRRAFPRAAACVLYGPTEATIICSRYVVPAGQRVTSHLIGAPLSEMAFYVCDPQRSLVPIGVPGELYIGGAGVARGYLNRPELTAERFVPNPFLKDEGGRMKDESAAFIPHPSSFRLYRTGDLVRWRPDRTLEFLGRVDQQVKLRGYRIELGEIEATLARHEAVRECAVLAREDMPGEKRLVAYVVPAPSPGDADEQSRRSSQQVARWRMLFDDVHSAGEPPDPTFDIAGWNSSYTGEPIPVEEMREWVDQTVARILALQPRRVLEIGCGTGLLLFRIAPHCAAYLGTDFSDAVLSHLRERMRRLELALPQIALRHQAADDFTGLAPGAFDLVILNSVAQYFPSLDYLQRVLAGAAEAVAPGGYVFVGDVRSLPLLGAFHTSIELAHAPDTSPTPALQQSIQRRTAQEQELVIDPAFFAGLPDQLLAISRVIIRLKRGRGDSELTRFRYDVLLRVGAEACPALDPTWRDWDAEGLTLAHLRRLLVEVAPEVLAIAGVPNARVAADITAQALLFGPSQPATAGELKRALHAQAGSSVAPEDFWALGEELGYVVDLSWSAGAAGRCDVVFRRRATPAERAIVVFPIERPPAAQPREAYATHPLHEQHAPQLQPQLRSFLQQYLPDYMIPSAFVLLDALPLTPNGKLDRKGLPAPDAGALARESGFVAPRTPAETGLAAIWADVLGLERVGVEDNFFALGGHSLLATQVIARVRELLRVDLPLRALFETPTVAGLAGQLEAAGGLQESAPPPLRPVARDGRLPLSFAQQRLWFLDRLMPNSPAYNMPTAVRLSGSLDIEAFQRSLSEIVRRHEVLRTTFAAIDGEPIQVIGPAAPLPLPLVDLQARPEPEREAEVLRRAAEEARRPFDLARGPLLRATLLRLGAAEHVLLLTMHHIISDGWSIGVFVRELVTLYAAFAQGEGSPLPELPIQYADYATWQRAWLRGEVRAAQLAYWKAQLAGAPDMLDLPADRPRVKNPGFRGARMTHMLPRDLAGALNALSQREGATLFMTLLAGFASVLFRYTAQDDMLIGTRVAGRTAAATEPLIGFFLNALALRADLRGNPSFRELLARVRESALGAFAHQDLPFEELVRELQPARDTSHHPLFQVMFVLQNAPLPSLEIPGLKVRPVEGNSRTAKYDLDLSLIEEPAGLLAVLEYNVDLFDADRMERLLGHFQTLLAGAVAAPETRLPALPLLTEAERAQLLDEWTATQVPYPHDTSLAALFVAQAARTPDAVAFVFDQRPTTNDQRPTTTDEPSAFSLQPSALSLQMTYAELERRAAELAERLRAHGAGPETPVGVCLDRSLATPIALLAILMAGATYVPLDPAYPAAHLAFVLGDTRLPLLISTTALAGRLPPHSAALLALDAPSPAPADRPCPAAPAHPDQALAIMYTSGSTGTPKGVVLTQRQMLNRCAWLWRSYPFAAGEVAAQRTSVNFTPSLPELLAPLLAGVRTVILPDAVAQNPAALAATMRDERISRIVLVPALLQLLLDSDANLADDLAHVRLWSAGGEALTPELLARFRARLPQARLLNQYGASEVNDAVVFDTSALPAEAARVPIGRPIANLRAYVLDRSLQPVPIGVPGELHLASPGLARGYLNRPELTAEKFIPNPFLKEEGGGMKDESGSFIPHPSSFRLYRTGDVVRWRVDGTLEYLGRRDHQVKLRGVRIELAGLEALLRQHPEVADAAVVLREDVPGDPRLVAYVVTSDELQVTRVADSSLVTHNSSLAATLRTFLAERLPGYMIPSAFMRLDALPRTPNGKLDRRALPAPERARPDLASAFVAPRTPAETKLAAIWEELLDIRPIGVADNFFQLGGHSLLIMRMIATIQKEFGQSLPLSAFFEGATIEQMAAMVGQPAEPRPWSPLVEIQPSGSRRPFFCVHPASGEALCYIDLAYQLGADQPFYGLQAPGLTGEQEPCARVEDAAALYIQAIRQLQPEGPYLIGGWSLGGTIAFEMARQLHAQGQEVALLALFDSGAPLPGQPAEELDDTAILAAIAGYGNLPITLEQLRQLMPEQQEARVFELAKQARLVQPEAGIDRIRYHVNVTRANDRLLKSYVPGVYPGRITFFRATDFVYPQPSWEPFSSQPIEVHDVPGKHFNMVYHPHVVALAEELARCLQAAEALAHLG